jgi:hypothetical protein
MACPVPIVGPGQTLLHEPQCAGCVGSTQEPLQFSDVGSVHPVPQAPLVHVAPGPGHALSQLPQLAGLLGSTQVPLQLSESGAEHASDPSGALLSRDPLSGSAIASKPLDSAAASSADMQSPRDAQSLGG